MKTRDPKLGLLQSVPGLSGVREQELASVAALVDELRVEPGTVLAREGATCHEVALILEGRASLSVGGRPEGHVGPGELLGALPLLEQVPHTSTALAETPMRMLLAGPESYGALLSHPAIQTCVTSHLVSQIRRFDESASS